MTNEEIEAEIQKQSGVIVTPHEGAAIAHYLTACRQCCLQHFMALEREQCAKKLKLLTDIGDRAKEIVKSEDGGSELDMFVLSIAERYEELIQQPSGGS